MINSLHVSNEIQHNLTLSDKVFKIKKLKIP